MSASLAFGSPIEELIDGEMVRFPRLNMREASAFRDTIRANRVGAARTAAVEQGDRMSGPERAGFIAQSSANPVTDQDVWNYLCTRPGIESALKASLVKSGKQDADALAVIEKLDFYTAQSLAHQVEGAIVLGPSDKIGKPEERKWDEERLVIREFCPNLGAPEELTRDQYEQAWAIAKIRREAKQQQAQG